MKTCVVGLGQRVAGDDGVGLRVLEALREARLPPGVKLHEARDATELVELVGEVDELILVDAVIDVTPGAVLRLDVEQLDARAASAVSSHGMSVGGALELGRTLAGKVADVSVVAIGIEAPSAYSTELSAEVSAAIPQATSAVLKLVRRS